MNGFMQAVGSYLDAHATPLAIIGVGLVSAIVRHMPPARPKTLDDLYAWFRSSAQEAANQRGANPTLPGA